mgnify:CR=1 FL=1
MCPAVLGIQTRSPRGRMQIHSRGARMRRFAVSSGETHLSFIRSPSSFASRRNGLLPLYISASTTTCSATTRGGSRVIKRYNSSATLEQPESQTALTTREWRWASWTSTEMNVESAIKECVEKIKPQLGNQCPDLCVVFSTFDNPPENKDPPKIAWKEQSEQIPFLLQNMLQPRTLIGRYEAKI